MKTKKTSSTGKMKEGTQADYPSPLTSAALPKPRKPAGTTKIKSDFDQKKQKTRQWITLHARVFKEICHVAYHDMLLICNMIVWITLTRHDELIQIIMLLIVLALEYKLHAILLLQH